jgi:hypothetical protein
MDTIFSWLTDKLNDILNAVLHLLPDSPFHFTLSPEVQNILGYVNWFVPFDLICPILFVWTNAVLVYYAYRVVLKWTKID